MVATAQATKVQAFQAEVQTKNGKVTIQAVQDLYGCIQVAFNGERELYVDQEEFVERLKELGIEDTIETVTHYTAA